MDRHTTSDSNTLRDRRSLRRDRNNVIAMQLDAAFFFERGVRYLERNQLKKALHAFHKTVEYEPNNPINYCNLAGVLSELGDFEGSNEALLHVLEKLDPEMTECQFYLANNYANMGQYDIAEEYVIRYLDKDPEGEFAPDAEEMLDILMDEFGGGEAYAKWEETRKERERTQAIEDGRHFLEEGQFEAAVQWLEGLIKRNPDDTAARNNLSLAYYYTGRYQQAIETAEQVLEREPDNIHGLCNLAVFTAHIGSPAALVPIVKKLKKVFPLHYDHAMKIATTLGIIGEHGAAFEVFSRLARLVDQAEPVLMHSIAASAANSGRFGTARKWWKVLSQEPDMADVALYYLDALREAEHLGLRIMRVSYQYDVPLQVKFAEMKKRLSRGDIESWRNDPLLRTSLYWGLRHGTDEMRRAVIRTLSVMGDPDAERTLRSFLQRQDIPVPLQAAALYALQRMGARGRVELWSGGQEISIRMSDVPKDIILAVDSVWSEIYQNAEKWLSGQHKKRLAAEAKRVWSGFLRHAFGRNEFVIGKPEIWTAALVYSVLKRHGIPVRQKDVAEEFKVSTSSVSKAAGKLSGFFLTMP
jgi:tetratricopeptide (TPR) repeat protein